MKLSTINLRDPAIQLGFFGMVGISLVSLFHFLTFDTVRENRRNLTVQLLEAVLSGSSYDNDVATDILIFQDNRINRGNPIIVYRARLTDRPVAVVFSLVAPDGYNGEIKLLLGLSMQGVILGARVIEHKETPGLGDKIDDDKSNWLRGFTGHSLLYPGETEWTVNRDGGSFDQIAGATITSRAVVNLIRNTLVVFHDKQVLLLGSTTPVIPHIEGSSLR